MIIYKKTKIVATIGPSSSSKEVLTKMIDEGMNVARLNFSHGDKKSHLEIISTLRELIAEGNDIGIMLDTKGPEIRTGEFQDGKMLYEIDDIVEIHMKKVIGTKEKFSVTYPGLFDDLGIGDTIKIDDGKLSFIIIDKDKERKVLIVRALNSEEVRDRRNVVAPFKRLNLPFVSKKDREDIVLACKEGLDFIALSFTRTADDVLQVRAVLEECGNKDIFLIAKIENQEGVNNIDEILEVADGVMVARGDLGVELAPEEVPVVQKMLIKKCRRLGKNVIVATQMLESMQYNPKPTRAEVSDVANAIFEGVDAVMLSSETAIGKYPVEAVKMQSKISSRIEAALDYRKLADENFLRTTTTNDAIAFSVANTALLLSAKLIIAFSMTGATARRMSYYRPKTPIISVTKDNDVIRRLSLSWGVYTYHNLTYHNSVQEFEEMAQEVAKKYNLLSGDLVILTGGDGEGSTNFMKLVKIV